MCKVESPVDTLADILKDAQTEKLNDTMALDNRGPIRHACGLASKSEGRVNW